jgi:hypothetical protein
MTDTMTIRLKDRDKETLAFTSMLTGIPSSKLLYPFLSEGVRVNLGATVLFNIDRNTPYQRARYERFIETLHGKGVKGHNPDVQTDLAPSQETTPRIVLDFFWMFKEVRAAEKMEQAMGEVQFAQDMGFVNVAFLRTLCLSLGEMYVSRGLSLSKIEIDQARRAFFYLMTSYNYQNNARGTGKVLAVKWYTHQDLVNKLVDEMVGRYEMRYPTKVVEAIEVREAIPVVPKKHISRTIPPQTRTTAIPSK